jgi:hypothetical protein
MKPITGYNAKLEISTDGENWRGIDGRVMQTAIEIAHDMRAAGMPWMADEIIKLINPILPPIRVSITFFNSRALKRGNIMARKIARYRQAI